MTLRILFPVLVFRLTMEEMDIGRIGDIARQRLGKHIPAEAYPHNRTSIARQGISKQAFSTIKRLCFLRTPRRGVVKGRRRSVVILVVENWVELWSLKSKMIEKKCQEMY
jgi:hypothetical protein